MKRGKKSLSQNFLIDKNIGEKIVSQVLIKNQIVLEIGPGYGFLTDFILKKNPKKLYLIEKDNDLYLELKKKYKYNKKVIIFNIDALNYDYSLLKNYKIISNLPYNISTKLILKLFTFKDSINEMLFMIQKEVAQKFDYNSKKLNKYKFMTAISSKYDRVFLISRNVFYPKPKVTSEIVKFTFNNHILDWNKINNFVKTVFLNKRKKLASKLDFLNKNKLVLLGNKRIEELNSKELLEIYNFF